MAMQQQGQQVFFAAPSVATSASPAAQQKGQAQATTTSQIVSSNNLKYMTMPGGGGAYILPAASANTATLSHSTIPTSTASQLKAADQKQQQAVSSTQTSTAQTVSAGQQHFVLNPYGMSPQASTFPQIMFRQQDMGAATSQPIMLTQQGQPIVSSSPTTATVHQMYGGQLMSQAIGGLQQPLTMTPAQLDPSQQQQHLSQHQAQLQPPTSTAMKASLSMPSAHQHAPPGKQPIPRNPSHFTPVVSSPSANRMATFASMTASGLLQQQQPQQPQAQQQHPSTSPKPKQQRSPRGSLIGRPPGPAKSALAPLRAMPATAASMSPPRLPLGTAASPSMPTSPHRNSALGPPVLQSHQQSKSSPLLLSQPPVLQAQVPLRTSTLSSQSASLANNSDPVAKTYSSPSKLISSPPHLERAAFAGTSSKPMENGHSKSVLVHLIDGHRVEESSVPFKPDCEDKGKTTRRMRIAFALHALSSPPHVSPAHTLARVFCVARSVRQRVASCPSHLFHRQLRCRDRRRQQIPRGNYQ
jgi:hypothetical protein